jgi:hypothetical protein
MLNKHEPCKVSILTYLRRYGSYQGIRFGAGAGAGADPAART